MDTAQLRRPRTGWEAVRRNTATPPYPVRPRRPPESALLGLPMSTYDRMRDALGLPRVAVMSGTLHTKRDVSPDRRGPGRVPGAVTTYEMRTVPVTEYACSCTMPTRCVAITTGRSAV